MQNEMQSTKYAKIMSFISSNFLLLIMPVWEAAVHLYVHMNFRYPKTFFFFYRKYMEFLRQADGNVSAK